jgi:hypothetical protein
MVDDGYRLRVKIKIRFFVAETEAAWHQSQKDSVDNNNNNKHKSNNNVLVKKQVSCKEKKSDKCQNAVGAAKSRSLKKWNAEPK